jgi:hypothetical protein
MTWRTWVPVAWIRSFENEVADGSVVAVHRESALDPF